MPKTDAVNVEWRNRIVRHGSQPADQFLANPRNPRRHPQVQRDAVRGSLNALGWIAPVIVSSVTGYMIDGRERVWQALQNGNTEVPFIEVDLTEEEESLALATFDWITYLAEYDHDVLSSLLDDVKTDDAALQSVIVRLAEDVGITPPTTSPSALKNNRGWTGRNLWFAPIVDRSLSSMGSVTLKLDWCSHDAAKYAVEKWHYSRSCPTAKTVKIGAWENGGFIGAVVFSPGANQHLGNTFGLSQFECIELVRVALKPDHQSATSRIVAIALKMLKSQSPGLRLVVSYADVDQDHHGGIYQAGNWLYLGMVQLNGGTPKYLVNGKVMHGRSVHQHWGKGSQNLEWLRKHVDPNAEHVFTKGKHKYVMPLDAAMRQQIESLRKPYPKRQHAGEVNPSDTPGVQPGEGGAIPTHPLSGHHG